MWKNTGDPLKSAGRPVSKRSRVWLVFSGPTFCLPAGFISRIFPVIVLSLKVIGSYLSHI